MRPNLHMYPGSTDLLPLWRSVDVDARTVLEAEARWELILESHREGEELSSPDHMYPQPDGFCTEAGEEDKLKDAVLLLKQNWSFNSFFDERGPWHDVAMRLLGLTLNPFQVLYRYGYIDLQFLLG